MVSDNQNIILHITPINQLFCLRDVIIRFLISSGAIVYYNFDPVAILCFGLIFILDAAPALYLHFEYFMKNKNDKFEISDSEIIFTQEDKIKSIIKSDNIDEITFNMSKNVAKGSEFFIFSMEGYYFASVKLKSGELIVLTCLLSRNLEKSLLKLKHVLVDKRERYCCNIDPI